ncbi:MAG: UvrD-helicase domain-containing protein, partial [Candidatus Dormibacteraceae bacterium]
MNLEADLVGADERARRTLLTDFESTLFVDAGAGTGKTTAIVGRIAELVAQGRLAMAQLVAITFTEAAAAELRTRVREALQALALDPLRAEQERSRCARAGAEIADASIDTIHAFAGDLLRTYPLQAGLPPDFNTMDEIEAELDFDEHFRSWFERVADDSRHREPVRMAILLGLGPDHMQRLALALHEHHDLLNSHSVWPCPAAPDPVLAAHQVATQIDQAQRLLMHAPPDHPSIATIEDLSFARERLAGSETADQALLALESVAKITVRGDQKGWGKVDQVNAFKLLKAALAEVTGTAQETLAAQRTETLCHLLAALSEFVLDYAGDRRSRGVATFQDLLAWARDLLRDGPEVRQHVQKRWSRIFIDEFQDTDPLQAE